MSLEEAGLGKTIFMKKPSDSLKRSPSNLWRSCTANVCSERKGHFILIQNNYIPLILYQLLVSSFSSSTRVSSLKWLHKGVVVASRTTCSGAPFAHQLWNVHSDNEGVYTCRMELSNGTTVERNFSQPLNVVGMYVSSDISCYILETLGRIEGFHIIGATFLYNISTCIVPC